MKKLLKPFGMILSLLMLLSAVTSAPFTVNAAETAGDTGECSWSFDASAKTLTVTGSGRMEDYAPHEAVWSELKDEITSVVIGEGVTHVGSNAFRDLSLKNVTLPETLVSIGEGAFTDNGTLKKIALGNHLTTIGEGAFSNCGLESLTVPDSVESLGKGVFFGNSSLAAVTLGEKIKTITDYAFMRCGIKELAIPKSVETVGIQAFCGNEALVKLTLGSGVKTIGNGAFLDCRIEEITIPDGVETVGEAAFASDDKLKTVRLGKNVKTIADHAFAGSEMSAIVIPENVAEIGRLAFGYRWDMSARRYEPVGDFTVYGKSGTAAQTYAKENSFIFTDIDSVATVGDVNGDGSVTIDDATELQKHLAQIVVFTTPQEIAANTNGDGMITIDDATQIQKYLAKLIENLG